jgi:hypothetical protein
MTNEKTNKDLLYKIFKTETKTTYMDGIRIEKQINIQIKPYILLSQLGKLNANEIEALLNKEELELKKIFKLNQDQEKILRLVKQISKIEKSQRELLGDVKQLQSSLIQIQTNMQTLLMQNIQQKRNAK